MAPKKQESVLGLAPLSQTGNGSLLGLSPSYGSEVALTKTEQRMALESRKQAQVIRAQAAKTALAMEKINEMHQHAADEFHATAQHLSAVRQQAAGTDYQAQVDEFTKRDAQLAAQHTFGALEVGARKVAEEVHRSLYLADVPEEKRGLIRRLIGG